MTSDPIFDLVHSMTTHEKIFFKRYAMLYGKKEPNYLKLFEAIDSLKEYDEEKLKLKLRKTTFLKRLAFERNYLKTAILEALRAFGNSKYEGEDEREILEVNLRRELDYALILRKRNIPSLAIKTIQKVKKEAQHHELFLVLKQALRQEQLVVYEKLIGQKTGHSEYARVYAEHSKVSKQTANIDDIAVYNRQVVTECHRVGMTHRDAEKEQLLKLADNPIIGDKSTALSTSARFAQLSSLAFVYSATQETELLSHTLKEQIAIINSHPQVVLFQNKVGVYSNYILTCRALEKFKEGNATIEKYYTIPCPTKWHKQFHFVKSTVSVVPFLVRSGQFERALSMEPEIYDFFDSGAYGLATVQRENVYCSYIVLFIVLENYDRALSWHEFQQREPNLPSVQDTRLIGNLCAMIAHYELGNYSLVPNLCRSVQRTLGEKKFDTATERTFIHYIQKMPPKLEVSQYWQDFKAALEPLLSTDNELAKFSFLDFLAWVESKIQKRPLREIMEEKRKAAWKI